VVVAAWCLQHLGLLAAEHGDLSGDARALRGVIVSSQSAALQHHQGELLETLAVLGLECGLPEIASRLFGAAAAVAEQSQRDLPERLAYDRAEAQIRLALGEDCYARAWTEGRSFRSGEIAAAMETILEASAKHAP
jgi:hypothetical protein